MTAVRPGPGRHLLVWLALALVPAFTVTALVAHAFREKHDALAVEWTARGERALHEARAADAVDAFRTALTFDRDNRLVRLRLAQALSAADRHPEANAYLLTLWETQPGNGPVNLELGRLAARSGDVRGAERYYHNAIEGAWADGAEARRRQVRLELTRFLVQQRATDLAQAELIHLSNDLPDSPATRQEVADLLLAVGMPERALELYRPLVDTGQGTQAAAAGAGRAAFALGDDVRAERYLGRAVRAGGSEVRLAEELATVRAILANDPFARRLALRERAARASRGVGRAMARLQLCGEAPAPIALRERLAAVVPTLAPRRLAAEPEGLDAAMDLVFEAERYAEQAGCGAAEPLDRALLTLAERRARADS